jgi:putative glutamine amidotransferase
MNEAFTRPVIGMTTYRQTSAWGPWDRETAFLPATYVDVVNRSGGQPVLVPPAHDGPAAGATTVCDVCDGIVLTGGGDVGPEQYERPRDPRTTGTNEDRDRLEFELLHEALRRGLPVLAVCRGLQVLNVALGGDLVQHLPDRIGTSAHQPAPGCFAAVVVTTAEDSHVRRLCGERVEVRCSHHQALGHLGDGLRVTARSDDGVIEAAELEGPPFVVGVQWHPEEPGDTRLFEGLVAASLRQSRKRPSLLPRGESR